MYLLCSVSTVYGVHYRYIVHTVYRLIILCLKVHSDEEEFRHEEEGRKEEHVGEEYREEEYDDLGAEFTEVLRLFNMNFKEK